MPGFEFEVEYAKSNRSSCKHCKAKIDKDALRVGMKKLGDGEGQSAHIAESAGWHHFGCFQRVRGVPWFKKNLPASIEQVTNSDKLEDADRNRLSDLFRACRGEGSQPDEKGTSSKRKAGGSDEGPAKAAKLSTSRGAFTDKQFAAFVQVKEGLTKRNAAMLGAMLAHNGLPKSGHKDELTERVAECQVMGVPPKCPLCDKVKLRWSRETGGFSCPGYFDEESASRKRCKGPGDGVAVEFAKWQELTV